MQATDRRSLTSLPSVRFAAALLSLTVIVSATLWPTVALAQATAPPDIYAISSDGTLNCYQHDGYLTGATVWQNDHGLAVGTGWNNFKQVFSAAGAIYAIQPDGTLLWDQHNGSATCAAQPWTGPLTVGSGWQNYKQVFPMTTSTGSGAVIYAIQSDGTLQWYKHLGSADGSAGWSGPNNVGSGWQNYKQVFSTDDGVIYAVQSDGTLQWFKHLGYAVGDTSWSGPLVIGSGWQNYLRAFLGSPAPTPTSTPTSTSSAAQVHVTVVNQTFSVACCANNFQNFWVKCPTGTTVVGGGFLLTANSQHIFKSVPYDYGWVIEVTDDLGPDDVGGFATCLGA